MRTALVASLAVLGCGGSDPTPAGVDAAGDADPAEPDAAPAITCTGKAAQPLDATWTVAGRTARVHVPASYDPAVATAVVLNFHGYVSSGDGQATTARMREKSDAAGFIAVHPEGTGFLKSWNGGACCGTAVSQNVDDVGFVGALIDELESRLCVDADRVFAAGFSNGGFLSHRLACELAGRIAAVAPVSGVIGIELCVPARPVPVFHVHGTADSIVAYNGGSFGYVSVATSIAGWVTRNGCAAAPVTTFAQGDATCVTHGGCAAGAEVTLCTIDGGGHQWPGGVSSPGGGHLSTDLSATDAMWSFFVAHPRP